MRSGGLEVGSLGCDALSMLELAGGGGANAGCGLFDGFEQLQSAIASARRRTARPLSMSTA
jgi:hypothetical protein